MNKHSYLSTLKFDIINLLTVIYDMRTVEPVDREYVLFNKHIIIFSELHRFFCQWAINVTVIILFWKSNP